MLQRSVGVVLVLILPLLAVLATPGPAVSQALGVFAVAATSDQPMLAGPDGFGVSFSAQRGHAALRAEYVAVSETGTRDARFCTSYSPAVNCRPGPAYDDLTLHSLRAGGGPRARVGPVVGSLQAGVSMNVVRGDSRGPSNLHSNLELPKPGHAGAHLSATIAVQPLRRVALQLEASALGNWVAFDGCRDAASGYYAPFCGVDRFQELRLGASFRFGG